MIANRRRSVPPIAIERAATQHPGNKTCLVKAVCRLPYVSKHVYEFERVRMGTNCFRIDWPCASLAIHLNPRMLMQFLSVGSSSMIVDASPPPSQNGLFVCLRKCWPVLILVAGWENESSRVNPQA